jgi:hypothetical protein
MAKLHSRSRAQHRHWFALFLLCSALVTKVSSLVYDVNEDVNEQNLIPLNEMQSAKISSLPDEEIARTYETHLSRRRHNQLKNQYLTNRYLAEEIEDDEIFFDSNGMPIQGMHDDDAAAEVEEVQVDQASVNVGTGDNVKQSKDESKDAVETTANADEQKQLPAASATENNNEQNEHKPTAKPGDESKQSNKIPSDSPLPFDPDEQQSTKPSAQQSSQPNEPSDNTDTAVKTQPETIDKPSVIHNTKLFNNTYHHSSDNSHADTIFDDILRGFSFASLFCICMVCLHKTCWYTCIRCGILPDDRVVEARWRRFQMKKKRAYFNPHAPPPMDTKSLGKWFDQRDRMHPDGCAGIWDSSAERSVGSWDEESMGAIDFDNDGIQLSTWDRDDASSTVELEYGEGDELEDRSHDERLFDVEDGGAGIVKQANKFFDKSVRKQPFTIRNIMQTSNKDTNNNSGDLQKANVQGKDDVSDDAFFDALEPPSGRVNAFSAGSTLNSKNKSSSDDANGFLQDRADPQNNNDRYDVDDRGYDEESDLLGLRSDSPPPLDLEEIEKKLREDMKNAKRF